MTEGQRLVKLGCFWAIAKLFRIILGNLHKKCKSAVLASSKCAYGKWKGKWWNCPLQLPWKGKKEYLMHLKLTTNLSEENSARWFLFLQLSSPNHLCKSRHERKRRMAHILVTNAVILLLLSTCERRWTGVNN